MEIAILAFFLAIFGGVLFLLALVWFIFRRVRKSRGSSRKFSGGTHHDSMDSDHDHNDAAFYAGSALLANQNAENQSFDNPVYSESARAAATQSENVYSHESHGASSAPAEPSYSNYDAGSSYDSSSSPSSDSGSSSSDSGDSSSSSSSD